MSILGFVLAALSFAETGNADQDGRLVVVAGGGANEGAPALQAKLMAPFGVDFDSTGNLYFVEMTGHRVRKVDSAGAIEIIAGTGKEGSRGDGGTARDAEFNGMHSLAVSKSGDVYVADTWNNRVRKIDAKTGRITTIAGTGRRGFSGDGGLATSADFGGIYCVALDESAQTLHLADLDNHRIRKVDLNTGIVTTVAGNGKQGTPKDGDDATSAPLFDPRAVAVDGRENVYILERSGHALRVVDKAGRIRTLIGDGTAGSAGDGGPAKSARLNGPKHLCVDRAGNVVIADTENHRIRVYNPEDGTIHNLAGTGRAGSAGIGGPAVEADLRQPHGVAIGPNGDVHIADSGNDRVLALLGAATADDAGELQGTWTVVELEVAGEKKRADEFAGWEIIVKGDEMWLNKPDGMDPKHLFKVVAAKSPKTIDLTAQEGDNKGKTILGIYEITNEQFRFCVNISGDPPVRPSEFKTKVGDGGAYALLKRVK